MIAKTSDITHLQGLRAYSWAWALVTMAFGLFAILGWQLDISFMTRLIPSFVPMNPLTAIFLILLSSAFLLLPKNYSVDFRTFLTRALSLMVGSLLLLQVLAFNGYGIRLDLLLFEGKLGGNQIASNTMTCLFLFSAALFFATFKNMHKKWALVSQSLALVSLTLCFFVIIGYIYESDLFKQTGGFYAMSINTAFALTGLGLAILFDGIEEGMMSLLTSNTAGGILTRRLILFIIFVPLVLGWVALQGVRMGYYDVAFGTAALLAGTILIFLAMTWGCGRSLNRMDRDFKSQTMVLASILNRMGDGVAVVDKHAEFTLFNPAAEKILGINPIGISAGEWSKHFGVFLVDGITPFPQEEMPLVLALHGRETNDVQQFVRNLKRTQGVYISINARPVMLGGEIIGAVAVFRDITDQKIEEKKMYSINRELRANNIELLAKSHSAAKMASLGEMAAGVGHEVNNPLTAIVGMIDELIEALDDEVDLSKDKIKSVLATMKTTSLRIARIVRALRSFARDGSKDPLEVYSLKKLVNESLELCREKIRYKDIEFTVDTIPDYIDVKCHPTEILQVILNLVSNAQDAVRSLESKWIRLSYQDLGGDIEIAVTDSGSGISGEIEEKIFQPFFTTKEVGKGTGLGLSISREIMERHGGALILDRAASNTRFAIRLPKPAKVLQNSA